MKPNTSLDFTRASLSPFGAISPENSGVGAGLEGLRFQYGPKCYERHVLARSWHENRSISSGQWRGVAFAWMDEDPAFGGQTLTCEEGLMGRFTKRTSSQGLYSSPSARGFLTGPGLTDTLSSAAVCQFIKTISPTHHFCAWHGTAVSMLLWVAIQSFQATRSDLPRTG